MIPLRDSRRPRRKPWATWALGGLLALVFAWQLLAVTGSSWATEFGLVPRRLAHPGSVRDLLVGIRGLLLAPLLHGSLWHLAGNLLFLAIFGNDLEDRLGPRSFFKFFVMAAAVSGLAEVATDPFSAVPRIGASGAISGLLGAYLVAFPKARLEGLWPLGCLLLPARSPAWLFLPAWFLTQLVLAWIDLGHGSRAGIAWMAHLAGFLSGPPLLAWFSRSRKSRRARRRP